MHCPHSIHVHAAKEEELGEKTTLELSRRYRHLGRGNDRRVCCLGDADREFKKCAETRRARARLLLN
jgi:hypothetical protein